MPIYNQFVKLPENLGVVPAVVTDYTTKTSWVDQVVVSNGTVGAVVFQVKDKQAAAKTLLNISVPANSTQFYNFVHPVKMVDGITWFAGAAVSLHASITGYRLP